MGKEIHLVSILPVIIIFWSKEYSKYFWLFCGMKTFGLTSCVSKLWMKAMFALYS